MNPIVPSAFLRKPKTVRAWVAAAFVVAWALWAAWLSPRRAFLRDLETGMHAYLLGDLSGATEHLKAAMARRPHHLAARQLLVKVAVEEGLQRLHKGDREGAVHMLSEGIANLPADDPSAVELARLKERFLQQGGTRKRVFPAIISGFSGIRPASEPKPERVQPMEADREMLLKAVVENQRMWVTTIEKETALWRRFAIGGMAAALGIVTLWAIFISFLFHRAFGRRGWVAKLLETQAECLLAAPTGGASSMALPPGPGSDFRTIDFIEAELVKPEDTELAKAALRSYLEMGDPWIRARAAKAIHRLIPQAALAAITALIQDTSNQVQLSGIWALGELGTPESVELLANLSRHKDADIQKTALRCLVQIEHQGTLPSDDLGRLRRLLQDMRETLPWII